MSDTIARPALLDAPAAATYLGVTERFIRRLIAERRIAVVRIGRHVRIDARDLDAMIAAGRSEPIAQ